MSARSEDGNATIPVWEASDPPVGDRAPVPTDLSTDVCIVGAGISGLSVAYALVREGKKVLVLDDGPVGGGETGRTSAHLSNALDDRYYHLEQLFGEAGARIAAESHRAAIDSIEANVRALAIDCDFRRVDGYLFARAGDATELEREHATATRAGLAVAFVDGAPLPFATGRCLRFANQAELHPLAYLRGLATAIVAAGGRIYTGVRVAAIEGGDAPHVQLAGGDVLHAKAIVDASNASITNRYDLPLRQAAYRSYVIGFDLPAGEVPHALYWDTDQPYHYLRVTRGAHGREILLVGGADHRTGHGDPTGRFDELERWTRARCAVGAVVTQWSGQVMEPADALGYIGAARGRPNVFVVSGDSGNGLTNGALAGLLLPSLIRGDAHPWAELYAPTRSRHHGVATLLDEAVKSTVAYVDWVGPSDARSLADVPVGEGRVVRYGAHRIAAYRAATGVCHLRSARCPHLHAVVRWNPLERSWDCPAHGSRFDPRGCVVSSPSAHDLAVLAPDVEAGVRASEGALPPRTAPRIPQGAYYVASGLWPMLHLRSFQAATGTRGPGWLVRSLGGVVAAVGAALLVGPGAASMRRTRALGLGSALALGAAGVYVAARGRGWRVNLADAAVHTGFLVAWLARGRTAASHVR
jgi:glycine/D-amino acid oxidase-like deaminating enzyme/nitrite reductase/ring-hydroxylating ferredoxin subunit